MNKRISIKEIAQIADVSIGTVDRVLHNRGRVAEETKKRILKIIEEHGFKANIYARNFKLNKSYKIVSAFPDDNSYWLKMKEGIEYAIAELHGWNFDYHNETSLGKSSESFEQIVHEIVDQQPDGLIIAPSILEQSDWAHLAILDEKEIPYVFVDTDIEGSGRLCFIGQQAYQSGRQAASLLINTYDTDFQLWVFTNQLSDLSYKTVEDRVKGFTDLLAEQGLSSKSINLEEKGMSVKDVCEEIRKSAKPAHVYIPNSKSHIFMNELSHQRQELKLRVVGYDLIEENVAFLKSGSIDYLIDQQPVRQGHMALQVLFKKLVLGTEPHEDQLLPIHLITKENLWFSLNVLS